MISFTHIRSITSKLLACILVSYLLVISGVTVLSHFQIKTILDKSQRGIYTEKVDVVWENLNRANTRLDKTGLRDAYINDFQQSIISTIEETYYSPDVIQVKPVLLDSTSAVISHPALPKGHRIISHTGAPLMTDKVKVRGEFRTILDGKQTWCIYKRFAPWNWVVLYMVDEDIKYGDARQFDSILLISMITVCLLVSVILSYIIARYLRPIKTLTAVTSRISQGKMDEPIAIDSDDEIGTLARSFDNMRTNIQEKIEKLNAEVAERKSIERQLLHLQQYLVDIINSMPSSIIAINADKYITQWNLSAQRRNGQSMATTHNKKLHEVCPELLETYPLIDLSIKEKTSKQIRKRQRKIGEDIIYEDITIFPITTTASHVGGAVLRIDNITKEYEFEMQINHSAKMDAIGLLAGGIAHDFNNMLSGILGASQLIQHKAKESEDITKLTDIIIKASTRAADLTQKLLAFGRKGKIVSSPINIHDLLNDSTDILLRTLDKKIRVEKVFDAQNINITGDSSGLQNVFMNLGINASHAMQEGGTLTIKTTNTWLDDIYCKTSPFDIQAGEYVQIEFCDTGCGINPEHISKIFEPFFTTKEHGKGAGLGLAAAYGTIQDHKGIISVDSSVGEGTSFIILLHCSQPTERVTRQSIDIVSGSGNILLVDDEEIIRTTCKHMMEEMGYTVFEAENGQAAVDFLRTAEHPIDLAVMDMIMPVMDGAEAIKQIRAFNPDLKIVVSSGYVKEQASKKLEQFQLAGFLHKPYNISELSTTLQKILGSPPPEKNE